MYRGLGYAREYLSVGLSAARCVEVAVRSSGEIRRILDFPCGYGRVLRFLRLKFPNASIVACELDQEALEFCGRVFSVQTTISNPHLKNIIIPGEYDLIWCGSLVTHFTESQIRELLSFFYNRLAPEGVCVFTTHGNVTINCLETGIYHYDLPQPSQQKILHDFSRDGFAYVGYDDNNHFYGFSVASRQRLKEIAESVGHWYETVFMPHGWAAHHDVYVFCKRMLPVSIIEITSP